jgi:hypothetical protein
MTRYRTSVLLSIKRPVVAVIAALLALALSVPAFGTDRQRDIKQTVVSSAGYNCPIRLTDPHEGDLTETHYVSRHFPNHKSGLGELYIQFLCLSSDDTESVRGIVFAKYDKQRERWEPDFSALSSDDLALLKPVTKGFALRAVNSSGVGATQDAINGDPETRNRSLGFCLRHPPVILCGIVPAVARPYHDKVGLMPYALTLLESIEFVEGMGDGMLPHQ